MQKIQLLTILIILTITSFAQDFSPPAGQDGSTAISADSLLVKRWATSCYAERGFLYVANPDDGQVWYGAEADAIGAADNQVISLGDGGFAIVEFDAPISNHNGFDFAVFENSFSDTFLELAFVEVSSDGERFVRFPAISNTQTETQIGSFGELDASYIHNLAGKYKGGFGTPFDLAELQDSSGVDIQNITHIKIMDVVGTINPEFASYDSQGNIVNDPYPTAFESGGFDLDAVAVLDESTAIQDFQLSESIFAFTKNEITANQTIESCQIYSVSGQLIKQWTYQNKFPISDLTKGVYIIRFEHDGGFYSTKFIRN